MLAGELQQNPDLFVPILSQRNELATDINIFSNYPFQMHDLVQNVRVI